MIIYTYRVNLSQGVAFCEKSRFVGVDQNVIKVRRPLATLSRKYNTLHHVKHTRGLLLWVVHNYAYMMYTYTRERIKTSR